MACSSWFFLLVWFHHHHHGSSGSSVLSSAGTIWFTLEPPTWLEFTNGTGGTVSCSAGGHPSPPQVSWILAGDQQNKATILMDDVPGLRSGVSSMTGSSNSSATLHFPPFPASAYRPDVHSTSYQCRATSPAGIILSREVKVRAVLFQAYESQALGGASVRGGVAVLRCAVPPSVRNDVTVTAWVQEFTGLVIGPSLQGDGKHHMIPSTGDLYVYGLEKGDGRSAYRCRTQPRFSPGRHQLSSNAASIIITEPSGMSGPTMSVKQPGIVQIETDKTATIPCLAQGYPVPDIRWFRIETNGPAPTPMDEWTASFGVLVLEAVQPEDAGTYRCTATNSLGQAQYEVRLEVIEPLRARLEPPGPVLRIDQGQSVTLQCSSNQQVTVPTSTGGGLAAQQQQVASSSGQVKWFKDGQSISAGPHAKYQSSGWWLKVTNMKRADQGIYQCFVHNDRGTAQAGVRLVLGDAAPQLVHTFNEQTLIPGPFVTLRCSAVGNPLPDIFWLLDGQPLVPGSSRRMEVGQLVTGADATGYLNITNVQVEDGGEYSCVAKNSAGEAVHSARLNVYGLPYIRPMAKIVAVAEADVSVKCPVAGYPIMEVIWSRGDEILRDDGQKHSIDYQSGMLTIRSLSQQSDRGVYTCTARDRQGHSARRDFTIEVVVAPKMTPFAGQPDALLKLGERLTLTCAVVKGDLPLTIGWSVSPPPTSSSSIKTVQIDPYTGLLSIDSLRPDHAGNYSCHVSNPASRASQSQMVLIQVGPKMDSTPFGADEGQQQVFRQGTRTRLLCGVSQGDKPIEFSWTKDGHRLLIQQMPAVTVRDLDADSSVLTFSNLTAVHSGRYECQARNVAGVARFSTQLFVQVPPYWVTEPRDSSVLLGQPLAIGCHADGYPKPNVTWSRGDVVLTNRTSPPGLRVSQNGTLLVLRSARKSHQGRYTCRAVNHLGQEVSTTISVTVHAGPRFRDSLSRLAVKRDGQVTLHCIVEGDGPLHLAWRRSSSSTSLLSSNYRIRIGEKESPNGVLTSTLTIPNSQVEDTGIYICVASNSHGQVERDFQLTIIEPPEQPRHVQIQESFSRRVSLSWLPPAGSTSSALNPLVAYVVQYREAAHGMSSSHGNWQETESLPAYRTTYTLEGLQPSTSYQFRIIAETSADRGAPSDVIVGTTYGEPPGGSPSDLRALPVSSTSIRLTWSPISRSSWHSNLIGYHLGFRPEEAMSYNFTTIPLMDHQGVNNKPMEFTLYHLRKAVKYLLVVRPFNRYGEGPMSQSVSVTTLEDVPTASPGAVRCSATSWQSLDVTWAAPAASEHNGAIQHYRVHFYDASSSAAGQVKIVDGLHASLTGLVANAIYRVRVEAVTRKGAGPLSSPPLSCLTDETVPEAPGDLKAFGPASGGGSLTICWSPPSRPNGELLHYTLSVKAGNSGPGSIQRHTIPAAQTHYELDNNSPLPAFYEIWLTATNRAGTGEKSKVLRYSPGLKGSTTSSSAICSFGRRLVVPWKTAVDLPCHVLLLSGGSNSQPSISWTHNGKPIERLSSLVSNRTAHQQHFRLSLTDLKRTDGGNYTCSIRNTGESVTYQVAVLVPPAPVTLHIVQTGQEQIQVQWNNKAGSSEDLGSTTGFLLHWRQADGGDWEEKELLMGDRPTLSAQLDNLKCGTRYQIYLTGYNVVGTSPPSNTVTARTKGDAPLIPSSASLVASPNSTHVAVHLGSWQERGCPILSFAVEFKMDGETYWTTVSEDVQNLPVLFIEDLQPSTAYHLRIRAVTSAGSVPSEFEFVTLEASGSTPSPDKVNRAGRPQFLPPGSGSSASDLHGHHHHSSGSHVVLPWWLIGAVSAVGTCSLLGLMVACVCLYKTRNESRRLLVATTAANIPSSRDSAFIDGGSTATWNRSHKSGSTAVLDRGSTYELHSMSGDKMSAGGYSPDKNPHDDDIYPYATFELHRSPPSTKCSSDRERKLLLLPSRPPPLPSWSDLSTIEMDRRFHQGDSPTVSDSDLENLAGIPPEFNSNGRPRSIHGIIRQPKEYACNSSLKRFRGPDNDHQYTLPISRPSHPVPSGSIKKSGTPGPTSHLWSGQQPPPSHPTSWPASAGMVHRPKAISRNGVNHNAAESSPDVDHSIAV